MLPRILLIGPVGDPDWTNAASESLNKARMVPVSAQRSKGLTTRYDLTRATAVIANFSACVSFKPDGILKRKIIVPPVDDTIRLGWAIDAAVPLVFVCPDDSPYNGSLLIEAVRFSKVESAVEWVIDTFGVYREKEIDDSFDPLRLVVRDAGGQPFEFVPKD